jgi:hypothetical protein
MKMANPISLEMYARATKKAQEYSRASWPQSPKLTNYSRMVIVSGSWGEFARKDARSAKATGILTVGLATLARHRQAPNGVV